MTKIIDRRQLADDIVSLDLYHPLIASKTKAGQFIILQIDEKGERIPLTVNDTIDNKIIRIVFQTVGKTTLQLANLKINENIKDVVGPLGRAINFADYKKTAVVVGGLGCAIGYFSAKQLYERGTSVDIIAGFRDEKAIIFEKEMLEVCENLYLCSDDGSRGFHGFVSNQLDELLKIKEYDFVLTIGPLLMMKAVNQVTQKKKIKTLASLNPLMLDGSGMCGCCRITYDGKTKFACVDGPDFEADKIDFDELIIRNRFYNKQEIAAKDHYCRLLQLEDENHA